MIEIAFEWLIQFAVAFAATVAFAVIFHTPRKQYAFCGLTGASGWLVYTVYMHYAADVVMASFFAAVMLAYLSRIFSFSRREPVTIFIICGIFPIVPGAGIYYTGYNLFMGDDSLALSKGLETIKIAIAIALGLGIVLSLPRFMFTLHRRVKKLGDENIVEN